MNFDLCIYLCALHPQKVCRTFSAPQKVPCVSLQSIMTSLSTPKRAITILISSNMDQFYLLLFIIQMESCVLFYVFFHSTLYILSILLSVLVTFFFHCCVVFHSMNILWFFCCFFKPSTMDKHWVCFQLWAITNEAKLSCIYFLVNIGTHLF